MCRAMGSKLKTSQSKYNKNVDDYITRYNWCEKLGRLAYQRLLGAVGDLKVSCFGERVGFFLIGKKSISH